MKEEIKRYALSIGFDAVGVSRPQPNTWNRYAEWLAQGYHGEMAYLANREKERKDLTRVFSHTPGSVIVLAKNYLSVEQNNDHSMRPIIARYAKGDDYHTIIGDAAKKLCRFIEDQTGGDHHARWCVDTAPVLERDFAAQAGIGWFGKHTNLLSRTLGNWFFLAAVITTLDLEPDEPASAHCGSCTRCLDACPTDAFVSPYVLDARRCISYLTIELKDPIPRPLRPLIGRRIFGCDDCLEVCPWNRFAVTTNDPNFQPRKELETADLIHFMQLTDEQFRQWFKNSPIKRTKRRGLLRNVAVALGNTGNAEAIPVLTNALSDHEPLIRGHSAWALGQIGGKKTQKALQSRLTIEDDNFVKDEINFALSNLSVTK